MAGEAVKADSGIGMALGAERFQRANFATGNFWVGDGVAFDALLQGIFVAADTFTQGFITLVFQEFHMFTAHHAGGLDALVTFERFGEDRQGNAPLVSYGGGRIDERTQH